MNTPPSSHPQPTDSPALRYILLLCTALFMIILTAVPISSLHSSVKKITRSSSIPDLSKIAEKNDYKALPILENYIDYIEQLKEQIDDLTIEREQLSMEIQSQAASSFQNQDLNLPAAQGTKEALFYSLFADEVNGNAESIVCKNEGDDTISFLTYAAKEETFQSGISPDWEQYNRLEVDMYKRTGDWSGDIHQTISVVVPADLAEGTYRVCVFLRTYAGRAKNSQQDIPANGGTVKLLVGDQTVSSGSLRLENEDRRKGEDQLLVVRGGDTITLDISPQDNTHFFSYAICVNRDMIQTEGGTNSVQN